MSEKPVKAEHINKVLLMVRECEPLAGDVQLSILAFALVAACASCKVPKSRTIRIVRQAFNTPMALAPLAPGKH